MKIRTEDIEEGTTTSIHISTDTEMERKTLLRLLNRNLRLTQEEPEGSFLLAAADGKGPDKNFLEVGLNEDGEVIINHPNIEQDEQGGHLVFSPAQAENLALQLLKHAATSRMEDAYLYKTGDKNITAKDAEAYLNTRIPVYVPFAFRVPRKGDWYVNKLGDVVRNLAVNHSRRARKAVIVRRTGLAL